ncbi:MAG: heparinase II/III family protein [Balneolaceae bacterium]
MNKMTTMGIRRGSGRTFWWNGIRGNSTTARKPGRLLVQGLLAIVLTVASAGIAVSQDRQENADPLLVESTWTEDFAGGTVSAWFSYPLFEDTAFDFTLIPGFYRPQNHLQGFIESGEYFYPVDVAPPEDEDGFYLLRAYRPNSAGRQEIGVAYKKTMWTHDSSVLEFDYWLRYPVDSAGDLRVDLSGMDGRRYQAVISAPERAGWQKAELDIDEFTAVDGTVFSVGTGIDAVAVVLELDRGAPSEYVFVAIDNVRLDGRMQAGFELISPAAERFDHWPLQFARRHVRPGEQLSFDVRAGADLTAATATVLDPSGEPLSSPVSLSNEGDGRWVADEGFRLPPEALGPLTLVVEGRNSQEQFARSEVRLWNLEDPGQRRPRVLFTEEGRENMQEKISSHDRFADIWEGIVERAAESREEPFPEEVTFPQFDEDYLFPTIGDWSSQFGRSRAIFDNALVWYMDGDPEARDYAIESMLRMAGWEQWIHPWFPGQGRASYYPLGHAVMYNGLGYDLLYDELSEEQRETIRRGVMENGIIPTWQEYFDDDRIPNNTSNWISMAAGGSLVGLMAFYDDLEQDGWDAHGEPWFSGLAEKNLELARRTMMPDGGYGEGIGYQHITYNHAQDLLAALETMFGVEDLVSTLRYDIGHIFWLYISLDRTHDALAMGDSNPRRGSLDYWSWIARGSDDPVMKWFYAQRPGRGWPALLWDEPDAHRQGEAPEHHLPDSRIFPDKGNAVFRTGWQNDDAVFVYRAGPNFNHTHFDQGNFRFYALGEELITESGRASYYSDPYYWSHFIQSSGHNTVLVDNFPESQRAGDFDNEISAFTRYARITDALVSDAGGFVVSDLAPVYRAGLDRLTRRIWFADPGYAILEDRIVSSGDPHIYQVQLYPPDLGALDINSDREARIRKGDAQMRIRVLAPDSPRLVAKRYPFANRHITNEAPLHPQGALQITHDEPLQSQTFRVVMAPEKEGAGMPEMIREIEGDGYEGVELEFADGRVDRFYFTDSVSDGFTGTEAGGEFSTDARSVFVSLDADGGLRALTLEGATRFTYGDRFSFSSGSAAHIAMTPTAGGGEKVSLSGPMESAEEIRADFTTSAGGRVTVADPERGESRLDSSRSRRGGTEASVILSGGPLEIDIQ